MQKVALLTDSACDLSPELQEEHHIHILNFAITIDDRVYTEREDFTSQEYHQLLREINTLPITSHITPFRFFEEYDKLAAEGYTDVIVVTINAGASATNDAAQLAARQYAEEHADSGLRIHVVDSHAYSMAYGQALCDADDLLRAGKTAEEVVAFLEKAFACAEILLVPYTLKYVRHSGRISAAAALAGDFLGLRPLISLNDGESVVRSKVRGDRQVLPAMVKYMQEHAVPNSPYMVGTTDMENAERLAALCEEALGYPPRRFFYLGCAVSTNTGPETIALIYNGQPRR